MLQLLLNIDAIPTFFISTRFRKKKEDKIFVAQIKNLVHIFIYGWRLNIRIRPANLRDFIRISEEK